MYLYGAGGHSKVILDILKSQGTEVLGLFDDNEQKKSLLGLTVNPGIKVSGKSGFPALDAPVIISIGNNMMRAQIARMLHVRYGKAIHKSAIISSTSSIGEGTVVLHGSIVQAATVVGRHVLVNTSASIDQDNIIGD